MPTISKKVNFGPEELKDMLSRKLVNERIVDMKISRYGINVWVE